MEYGFRGKLGKQNKNYEQVILVNFLYFYNVWQLPMININKEPTFSLLIYPLDKCIYTNRFRLQSRFTIDQYVSPFC
uniref:Uncharacterized protein n=1 Tax=Anguilla anguilla TaxID=7936 RepID=A0A0E9WRW0_ANGAN